MIILAITYICGLISSFFIYLQPIFLLKLISALFLILLITFKLNKNINKVILISLIFFCGISTSRFSYNNLLPGGEVIITGSVKKIMQCKNDYSNLIIQSDSIKWIKFKSTIKKNYNLVIYGDYCPSKIVPGTKIIFKTFLQKIKKASNPGEYSLINYYQYQNIYYKGFIKNKSLIKLITKQDSTADKFIKYIYDFKKRYVKTLLEHSEKQESSLAIAILTGERQYISNETKKLYIKSGLAHLIAISGLHIGIITLLIYYIIIALNYLIPPCLKTEFNYKIIYIIIAILIWLYTFFSGSSTSVVRAALMLNIFFIARLFNRSTSLAGCLFYTIFIMILINPQNILSPSFQLSISAVGSILLFQKIIVLKKPYRLIKFLPKLINKTKHFIYETFLLSFSISIMTAPITYFHFKTLTMAGPLLNIIAIPIICFVSIPFGFISVFLFTFIPDLALLFSKVCLLSLKLLNIILNFLSNFTEFLLITGSLPSVKLTIIIICIFSFFTFGKLLNSKQFTLNKITLLSQLFIIIIILYIPNQYFIFTQNKLTITTLNVGNGDCSIVHFPNGESMIIDGGGSLKPGSGDYIANRIIKPFLIDQNIPIPKIAVLSHPHNDHLSGLISLYKKNKLKEFWTISNSIYTDKNNLITSFYKLLEEKKTKIVYKNNKSDTILYNGVQIKFINPDLINGNHLSLNNNSMVMEIRYGKFCYLFTGDIEKETEEFLLKSEKLSQCAVLKTPHHGSNTSSSHNFIKKISPEIVVITTASKNKLKHAGEIVFNRYKKTGATILQSDIHGAIKISTDGDKIELSCYLENCLKNETIKKIKR